MINMIRDFFKYWNSPPKSDYHLPNKEFACYSIGGMGVQGFGILTQYTAIVMGNFLAYVYNFDQWVVQITTWFVAILTIFRAPIMAYIIDNTNTKFGRFKVHLLWGGIASTVLLTMLGFIPNLFVNGPNAKWVVVIVYQIIYFLAMTAYSFFSYGRVGLAQVITPNTQERTKLYSIGGIIDSLGASAVQLFFPIIAGAVTGGMNSIGTFQILIPIFGVICSALSLFLVFGTKERMIIPKNKKFHIKFGDGMKKSLKNKYFWLFNTSTVLGFARLAIFSSSAYIAQKLIGGAIGNTVYGVMSTVLGVAFVPGMALAPLIIKKIGKKRMTILSFGGSAIISAVMLVFSLFAFRLKVTPWLMYFGIFLHNIFASLFVVTGPAMTADYCDFQQWKTGDRLDGFFANFSTVITTVCGVATGALLTFVLTSVGAKVSTDYDNLDILRNVFIVWGVAGIVCGILAIAPFFFWDLNEEKHKAFMEEIKKREGEVSDASLESPDCNLMPDGPDENITF